MFPTGNMEHFLEWKKNFYEQVDWDRRHGKEWLGKDIKRVSLRKFSEIMQLRDL